jgi:imidazolonepropionase-like amidohydrolase
VADETTRLFAPALLLAGPAFAAGPGAPIAIAGARIVTVEGPTLARGTLVIADGETLYPGLLDALTTLGVPGDEPHEQYEDRP